MTVKTHYVVKIAKRLNMEPWLYSFIYRGFRAISKKSGVHITTNNYGYHPTEIDASEYFLNGRQEHQALHQRHTCRRKKEILSTKGEEDQ